MLWQAGKFNMIPTLINMVAAFTSVGVVSLSARITTTLAPVGRLSNRFLNCVLQGTVLCDIILLNFLKGAEQYKAKKFEEVSCGAIMFVVFFTVYVIG